jgi:hypothetical protein
MNKKEICEDCILIKKNHKELSLKEQRKIEKIILKEWCKSCIHLRNLDI